MDVTIARHFVGSDPGSGLSPLQQDLLIRPEKVRIADAPTGAGKSYAFQRAMMEGERVLFVVPTRRLAQNLIAGLHDSLVQDAGWGPETVTQKLSLWTSDATEKLKAGGETNVAARRIREISGLNTGLEGGEMIVAVPEVVSHLLLRRRMEKGQTDVGVFEMLHQFEHIVFDEFHTIAPRGFGLAAVFAKLAAEYPACRARISFLSATPLDISAVLRRLEVPDNQVVHLKETLTPTGRPVHGDVRLSLRESVDMVSLLREEVAAIQEELKAGRQIVVIYNRLADLQRHLPRLEEVLKSAGIEAGRGLLIDSIDDSRINIACSDFFSAGRHQPPEQFDMLIATASVEMGVTFRTDLLFMEPGFEPLNFLQRYGRAARGDHDGRVIVRVDGDLRRRNPWLRSLEKWAAGHAGQRVSINDLTETLSRQARHRFKDCPDEGQRHFGKLPNRAAYSGGLFWNVLMHHFSNQGGHRWKHLKTYQPKPARTVFALLRQIREMQTDSRIGFIVKDWCDRFEQEARILRDIDKGVRVVDEQGEQWRAPEIWLRRNTKILDDRFPIVMDEDGDEVVHIHGRLASNLLDRPQFIKAKRRVRFPHSEFTVELDDDVFLIDSWCRAFRDGRGLENLVWERHPKSMAAAETLVRLTGLVVSDEMAVDSCGTVL
ncbi:putative CRISPR-associated helicase, Cyano-type [delta proteobacterium NaphS2]|nr:putative CRISPR-associated helicase, Cyano-type [delta proteobacterium NaphS2]